MSAIVVGVDPGQTTGIAALVCDRTSIEPYALQVRGHQLVTDLVEFLFDRWPARRPLLGVEKFVVSTRAGRARSGFAGRITRELVAQLQALEVDHDRGTAVSVLTWPAAAVKPWATDRRLEAAGLLEVTHQMRHARDAARCALYTACWEGVLLDPLREAVTG